MSRCDLVNVTKQETSSNYDLIIKKKQLTIIATTKNQNKTYNCT